MLRLTKMKINRMNFAFMVLNSISLLANFINHEHSLILILQCIVVYYTALTSFKNEEKNK